MKKAVIIYLVILLGLFAILSALDGNSDFVVEKKLWRIYKKQIEIAKDPNVFPDKSFNWVISEYQKIIEQHPDSRMIPGLHIHIGEMYALKKDYDGARRIFNSLIQANPDNKELSAEVMFKIGETYEVNNNWPEALKVYQKIIQDYTLTSVGLSTPIYIATHYRNLNDFQGAMNAYETAISHYKSIAKAHHKKRPGLWAMRHLSTCYLDQNRWTEAIETLGKIIEDYSDSQYLTVKDVDMMIKNINITAAYQLRNYDVAIVLYQGIIDRNPNHPLKKYLSKVIEAFKQLKKMGIQVSDRN